MSRGFMFDCLVGVMGAALALLPGAVGEARADNEVQKLTASDAAAGDLFGMSVSVSHDTVVSVLSGGNLTWCQGPDWTPGCYLRFALSSRPVILPITARDGMSRPIDGRSAHNAGQGG